LVQAAEASCMAADRRLWYHRVGGLAVRAQRA